MTFRALLLLPILSAALVAASPAHPGAAIYRGGAITLPEMEDRGAGALYPLRRELYNLQTRLAGDLAFDRLVEEEARQKKIAPEAYVKQEIDRRYQEPTAKEIQAMLPELRKTQTLPEDPAEAQKVVLEWVKEKARLKAFETFRGEVLTRGNFQMSLEPPRLQASIRPDHPSEGPAQAPITLVVYTDFECEYCKTLNETLKVLASRHRDQIRIVHKQTPLEEHPLARKAAQAYLRTGGKSEVKDLLFSTGGRLDHPDLEPLLKPTPNAPSDALLDERIDEDLRESLNFGISGTPALLVNGRLIDGAPPLELLERMIEEEELWTLQRRAASAPRP